MTHPLVDTIISGRRLRVVATERSDGDIHPVNVRIETLRSRQVTVSGRPWALLDQVHGTTVVEITAAGSPPSAVGDVAVTTALDTHIAVWAADCAPIVLAADDGTLVAAHAGWVGLAAGVIDAAVAAATRHGGSIASAVLGPVIHPCCYEFGAEPLGTIPDAVERRTRHGKRALDVPATVAATLAHHGVPVDVSGPCTGCDDRWFSHRVRNDMGRHAVVAWWEVAA